MTDRPIPSNECGDPGPGGTHCTDYPGHRWSCYDASADESFNERTLLEDAAVHECEADGCWLAGRGRVHVDGKPAKERTHLDT